MISDILLGRLAAKKRKQTSNATCPLSFYIGVYVEVGFNFMPLFEVKLILSYFKPKVGIFAKTMRFWAKTMFFGVLICQVRKSVTVVQ